MDVEGMQHSPIIGAGFRVLTRGKRQKCLAEVLNFMCEITVALDNYQCGGRVPKLFDIIAARNTVQHQLLSIPASPSRLPGPDECIYDTCRFAALIYSDMVLFALPPAAGVKPRLANKLRRALDCCTMQLCWDSHSHLLLWAVVLGGIASWSTPNRLWFVSQVQALSTRLAFDCWESCKNILSTYLWWDPVCDQPAIKLWEESRAGRAYSQGALLPSRMIEESPSPTLTG